MSDSVRPVQPLSVCHDGLTFVPGVQQPLAVPDQAYSAKPRALLACGRTVPPAAVT